jgi:hypothetical protein
MQKMGAQNREMESGGPIPGKIILERYFPLMGVPLRGMNMVAGGVTSNFFE